MATKTPNARRARRVNAAGGDEILNQKVAATRPGRRGDPGARDPKDHPKSGGRAWRCVEGKSAPGDPENREAHCDGAMPGCGGQSDEAQVSGPMPRGGPPHAVPRRAFPDATRREARPGAPEGRLGAGRVQEGEGPTRPDDRLASQLAECLAGVNVSLPGRPGPEGRTLPGREGALGGRVGPGRGQPNDDRTDARHDGDGDQAAEWGTG